MSNQPLKIMAFSGSLRAASTNTALIKAAALLAPATLAFDVWQGTEQLPHFSPDLEPAPPALVQDLRARIGDCDGVLIACPEYARGLPGSFKNLLDWLVGGETFVKKKVALWNASPRAFEAQKSLRLVLETMSGQIVEEAALAIPLISKHITPSTLIEDEGSAALIRGALENFARVLQTGPAN
jgi:chromate reductase, NAD(P)H dehydrogenase (quinone)